jgi:c-Jun-amino-terminal kinase-interacting protein 4
MTREVANLIRENSELLQTKHALNVLKDDLIVKLDQFSNEMLSLKDEIKSLQTVKACLQLRISELEEEAKKTREDQLVKAKKQEEEEVRRKITIFIS